MTDIYTVAVIVASVRADRVAPTVAAWFQRQIGKHIDACVDLIDLTELELPGDLGGGEDAAQFARRIERAGAAVIVTPEYNHGYPGPLKTAIDTAYREWFAKPVAFVSYGGSSGGLRAVEQLRGVFGELHVMTMQTGVLIPHVHQAFDSDGQLRRPQHAEAAAATMLRQLDWWARTLATARHDRPYEFAQS
jgi:NAD(P)H-dependent FMN reductase